MTYQRAVVIRAPVEEVFAFHEREDALQLLMPKFPPARVVRKQGGIERGARVELEIGGIRWVALHTAFEKNRLFVDEQVAGPFERWVHRHEFEDLGGRTRLTDRVEYRLRGGELANRALGWTVAVGLSALFRHRHRVTARFCENSRSGSDL